MRAIQITQFGDPGDVRVRDVATPRPASGEVLVKIEAAGVNPSDAVNIRGGFPKTTLPRIVGRDFAGTVVEGPDALVGAEVWGSGGELGFTRDGSDAEFLAVPGQDVSVRPSNLTAAQAAAAGLPFVTAYLTLIDRGGLKAGDWALISGASGSVGGAAAQVATWIGAHVVAVDRPEFDAGKVNDLVTSATQGRGADVALNVVGAAIFDQLLQSLAIRGRMIIISRIGGKDVNVDLFNLYRRQLSIVGVDSAQAPADQCARVLDTLRPGFESGALKPPRVDEEIPLDRAAEAYARAEKLSGEKSVLVP
ncbi:MAG: zinc-binding alcohol dehydrogenase family protein [Candidatus Aquilonibacter sp.]